MNAKTHMLRGSELYDEIIVPIFADRNTEKIEAYQKQLKRYEQLRGEREEQTGSLPGDWFGREVTGFYASRPPKDLAWKQVHNKVFVLKPKPVPAPVAYSYIGYDRSSGFTTHAGNHGLLADSKFNREISHRRVDEYAAEMQAGLWRDLLSDPITLTEEGQVVNGQHRLAAASKVDWAKVDYDPLFMVIWGVDPQEALHADLSKRTAKDQTTIVFKIAGEFTPRTPAVTDDEILEASIGTMQR